MCVWHIQLPTYAVYADNTCLERVQKKRTISGFVIRVYTRFFSCNLGMVCKLEVKTGSEFYVKNVFNCKLSKHYTVKYFQIHVNFLDFFP